MQEKNVEKQKKSGWKVTVKMNRFRERKNGKQ